MAPKVLQEVCDGKCLHPILTSADLDPYRACDPRGHAGAQFCSLLARELGNLALGPGGT